MKHFLNLAICLAALSVSATSNRIKIWEERGPIERLDLFWGSGSAQRAPQGPYTFLSENLKDTNPKIRVLDRNGVEWSMKWDEEIQCETISTRLVWAAGFGVEETYYISQGRVIFADGKRPRLRRAGPFIAKDGSIQPARMERKGEKEISSARTWSFFNNPFIGTKEYSAFAIMNTILNNWDTREPNNKIVESESSSFYIIGDYGATLGRMEGVNTKFHLRDFQRSLPVVETINGDVVTLIHKLGGNGFRYVPLEHAKWFAERIKNLTVEQIRDAFDAAEVSEPLRSEFALAIYDRIQAFKRSTENEP